MEADKVYWDELLKQVASITTASMIFLIIVALIYRKYWNRILLAAFCYYLATFLLNVLEKVILWLCRQNLDICVPILEYWGITDTNWMAIFFFIKDYIFLGWFFTLVFQNKRIGTIVKWVSIIFAFASVINYCFIEGYKVFGVFNPGINMFYVISLPLIYLWYSQRVSLRIPLKKNPYFWINIGLLVPNLLALFLYFSGDYIFERDFRLFVILNSLKCGLEIIGFVLVGIGFSRARFVRFITTDESPTPVTGS